MTGTEPQTPKFTQADLSKNQEKAKLAQLLSDYNILLDNPTEHNVKEFCIHCKRNFDLIYGRWLNTCGLPHDRQAPAWAGGGADAVLPDQDLLAVQLGKLREVIVSAQTELLKD